MRMGQLLAVSKMEAKGCSNLGCGHPYDTAPSTVKTNRVTRDRQWLQRRI